MLDRNKIISNILAILMLVVVTAGMAMVQMSSVPNEAYGMDAPSYVDEFKGQNFKDKKTSKQMIEDSGMGFTTATMNDLGSHVTLQQSIQSGVNILLLSFIPILFVAKFAGRAILSITQSGQDKMEIPSFFKTAEERNQGPNGGARDNPEWYIAMGKDFLRYFGVAVAIWAIFNIIIVVINFALTAYSNASGSSAEGNVQGTFSYKS